MRVPVPVIGPAYEAREVPISAQVTKGLYPEVTPEGRVFVSLRAFPGLKDFATLSGANRGSHTMEDVLYAVNGTSLYAVDATGAETNLGTVEGGGRCDFDDNGTQLAIATGGKAYVYTVADGLQEVADTDLVNPTTVGYLNSQFIWDNNSATSSSGEFVSSAVGDATDISALDFAVAESHPDDILRIMVHNQLVYFFGSKTIEPWYNSGVGRPPFTRVQGGVRPYGLIGPWAVADKGELIYFVDQDRVPRRLSGLAVEPIGTVPLGKEWASYATVEDCVVYAYTLDSQNFIQFNFPIADRTWVYHEQSNSWFQLSYGVEDARHRGIAYEYVYGKHIVADHSNGKLYELDYDTYTDNGAVIQRRRTTASIHSGLYGEQGREMFIDRVGFIMQTGEGLTTGQGSDPQLMVRFSDDMGRTWSAELWYPLGVGGDYLKRVVLTEQGAAHERIYELTYSDPTAFTLMSGWADMDFA